jgi:hypothetical protein
MADVGAIRVALAAKLATIADLQVSAYMLSNPTPPCAMIYSGETSFDKAFHRGSDDLNLVVRVIVPFAADIGSQVNLDEYRAGSGARSFKAALEVDRTLGGAVQDLRVTGVSPDTVYGGATGQIIGIGCEFQIEVKT